MAVTGHRIPTVSEATAKSSWAPSQPHCEFWNTVMPSGRDVCAVAPQIHTLVFALLQAEPGLAPREPWSTWQGWRDLRGGIIGAQHLLVPEDTKAVLGRGPPHQWPAPALHHVAVDGGCWKRTLSGGFPARGPSGQACAEPQEAGGGRGGAVQCARAEGNIRSSTHGQSSHVSLECAFFYMGGGVLLKLEVPRGRRVPGALRTGPFAPEIALSGDSSLTTLVTP